MNEFLETEYNPDVLECIANLSNDEVFTPPKIANAMLDLLPKELFCNPNTKFLDPCCKSGVFLREIAKRFLKGLKEQIPDLQERIDHIFKNQIYGISLTNLTSLLSRRSVYCAKKANSKYSVTEFNNACGNIFFSEENHFWINGKCLHCGISESSFNTQFSSQSEKHAYQFIHERLPGEIENMKFDVIIGNPPYQMSTGGFKAQATPLYDKFVLQAKKLNPNFLVMIIPARWYAGGMGLDNFRNNMLSDGKIIKMIDYPNAKDCFPGMSIGGGVCYFLWKKDYKGECDYTSISSNVKNTVKRKLNEYSVFVRYNQAIDIINKTKKIEKKFLPEIISSLNPYNISSAERGFENDSGNDLILWSSQGKSFYKLSDLTQGKHQLNKYHIMCSKTTGEHANEPGKDGTFKVLSKIQVLNKNEICTFSYFLIGSFEIKYEAENLYKYLCTKYVRFLLLQAISSINLTKDKFCFVPLQNFTSSSDIDWSKSIPEIDAQLYKKYNLTQEEIEFIESMIRPMQ